MDTFEEIDKAMIGAAAGWQESLGKALRGKSIWIEGIRRSEWPVGTGDRIFTSEITEADYRPLEEQGQESGITVPTVSSYDLVQKARDSDWICVRSDRSEAAILRSVEGVGETMCDVLTYEWKRRGVTEYTRLAGRKIVLASCSEVWNEHEFPDVMPDRGIDAKFMGDQHTWLRHNGAAHDGGAYDMVDGKPRFALVGDHDTPDFEGFVTIKESLPRRWKLVDRKWIEVMPYVEMETVEGTRIHLNPEYQDALVQDTQVFLPTVMEFLIPRPLAAGKDFDPMNYAALIKWLRFINTDPDSRHYNPDGTKGFFRATMQVATKPLRPDLGVVIRHLR